LLARPGRIWANTLEQVYSVPTNPAFNTWFGKSVAASAEIVARLTQNYGKPAFGLKTTQIATRLSRSTRRSSTQAVLPAPALHRDTTRRDPQGVVVAR